MNFLFFLKKEKRFLAAFLTLSLIVVGMFYMYTISAPQDFEKDNLVIIPNGSTLQEISFQLEHENVINSPRIFSRIVVVLGGESEVKAGSYYFKEKENSVTIAKRIISGDHGLDPVKITIPEGYTIEQISTLFGNRFERFVPEDFVKMTSGKEGYLFPDTYFFFPDSTAKDVIERMEQNFKEKTLELAQRIEESGKSLQEIITMASIVQGEAYDLNDMKKIAGVLWKRIEIDMPLQVDVTFRYINGKGTFDLSKEDLENDSPYNTYVHRGLPPTPISNPGLDAIVASIEYENSDYLYFLADNSGTIYYSKTFEEHKEKKSWYLY